MGITTDLIFFLAFENITISNHNQFRKYPVANPGFPRGSAPTLWGGGAPMHDFAKFSKNCMKLKEFRPGVHASVVPPLDPPMISFNLNGQRKWSPTIFMVVMHKRVTLCLLESANLV